MCFLLFILFPSGFQSGWGRINPLGMQIKASPGLKKSHLHLKPKQCVAIPFLNKSRGLCLILSAFPTLMSNKNRFNGRLEISLIRVHIPFHLHSSQLSHFTAPGCVLNNNTSWVCSCYLPLAEFSQCTVTGHMHKDCLINLMGLGSRPVVMVNRPSNSVIQDKNDVFFSSSVWRTEDVWSYDNGAKLSL